MNYSLYLESGPRRQKTMVHVLDLLGCIAQGVTTDAALQALPGAIRRYLGFLHQHGESVDPQADFTTVIAQHVTQGPWLGNGDPAPGFTPDFLPLSAPDRDIHTQRLEWILSSLLELVHDLPPEHLAARPGGPQRSFQQILEHVAESQAVYLRYLVGRVDGLSEALRAVKQNPQTLPSTLPDLWQICSMRLKAMTGEERAQQVNHGQVTWTARRALRRMLEHAWEHHLEISRRLGAVR